MNKVKQIIFVSLCCALLSCNSNALTQNNAEKIITAFLASHPIQVPGSGTNAIMAKTIGKTNIYAQFHTSVRVDLKTETNREFSLLFDFTRTPANKWFLESVEGIYETPQELRHWLKDKNKLHIAAQ